ALLIFPLAVFLAVMFGSRTLIRRLSERAILDHPNDRSSHTAPTPRGAGIAVVGALLPAWALIGAVTGQLTEPLFLVAGMALVLAVVSWIDDLRGLSPLVRIGVQAAAIAAVMTLAPPTAPVFGGLLPPALDHLAAGLIWLWFVNLYNFMDGIDGLAGVETLAIGVGAFVVARKLGLGGAQMALALTLAAAALGFLRWNWHPAKIFLGDVGSIPLGFLTGWLLLNLAAAGAWAPALILPLYFLADATWTLARRGLQGRRIWEAHREHFYQRAVDSGLRHDQVTWIIAVANMFLVMLSLVAMRGQPIAALLGAAAAITLLLVLLAKGGPTD
ncbi:MAG: glycosyltransferase family 4 protein, partial [Magnetovibrio sp.]|nr:glycosyltransferase family 4 protein [Magnetovibrio sp.]